MNKFIKISYLIIYTIIALKFIAAYIFLYIFEGLSILKFEFGKMFFIPIYALMIIIILSVFILLFNVFKEISSKWIFIVSCIALVLWLPTMRLSFNYVYEKYKPFSFEYWSKYPEVRDAMYKSLEDELNIVGKSVDYTKALIGEPDSENNEALIYKATPGYIELSIKDGVIESVYYQLPFD